MCFALRIPCAAQGLWLCYVVFSRGFEGWGGFRPFFPFDDPTPRFYRGTLQSQLSHKIEKTPYNKYPQYDTNGL